MNTSQHESAKLLPSSSDEESLQFPVDDVEGEDVGISLSNTVSMLLSKGMSSSPSNGSRDASSVANKTSKGTPNKASPLRLSTDASDFPCTGIPKLDKGIQFAIG